MAANIKFFVIVAAVAFAYFCIQSFIQLGQIKSELILVKNEFKNYKELVNKVSEIDTKFTEELLNAKAENNDRYDRVINGLSRLRLNQTATATAGVDDEKSCELTGEARQNYYLLRDDIITKDKMILGLQDYITRICLSP